MAIVITSKRDGFRRCGIAHSSKPTFYPDDFFTDEQLDALDKEPQLILAYARDEVDLVKDPLNEALSQIVPSQTSDTLPIAQPQAFETVIAPVVAPVGDTANADLGSVQPVPAILGADLNNGQGDTLTPEVITAPVIVPVGDSVTADQGDATDSAHAPTPQDATPAVKPARTVKPKADSK